LLKDAKELRVKPDLSVHLISETDSLPSGDGVHRIIPNTLCKKVFLPCEATGVVASPPTQCLILHKYCLEQVPVGLGLQRRDPHEASIEATEGNFVL